MYHLTALSKLFKVFAFTSNRPQLTVSIKVYKIIDVVCVSLISNTYLKNFPQSNIDLYLPDNLKRQKGADYKKRDFFWNVI